VKLFLTKLKTETFFSSIIVSGTRAVSHVSRLSGRGCSLSDKGVLCGYCRIPRTGHAALNRVCMVLSRRWKWLKIGEDTVGGTMGQ